MKYDNEHNTSFFKEFTKDLEDGDKVLFIGFARRDVENRMRVFERDKGLILAGTEKDIVVENAEYETLIDQVRESKAIFVTGGETPELIQDIQKYPEFRDAIAGKVYAGSSAGAQLTAVQYYHCSRGEITEGVGWLPVLLMVHYGNPEYNAIEENLKKLETYSSELELLAIPETEWVVREVDF